MRPRLATRSILRLALTANALRPSRGPLTAIPSFAAGWPTGELAPQLLGLTVLDAAVHVARHTGRGDVDRVGLATSALSTAGMVALARSAHAARDTVEDALTDALGPQYRTKLPANATAERPRLSRTLAVPFRGRDPQVRRDRNVSYGPGGKRALLDIYRPRSGGNGLPVLLQVHGGAWMIGSKDHQGLPLMLHTAANGWLCVAINYPLSPAAHWPEHIVAVKRALAWIRDNISDYGGDPGHVAITGGSAGGHLAALAALSPNDPRFQPGFTSADTTVQACVPLYGVYDFAASSGSTASRFRLRQILARYVVGNDPDQHHAEYADASPLDRVSTDAPPFFVLHGANDTLVPVTEARRFTTLLRQHSHNPVAYAELAGAQHAFDIFGSIRSTHAIRGVHRFLEYTRG